MEITLEQVRQRPGMFVGDTDDGSGALVMLVRLVERAVEAHRAGRCARVDVRIDADHTVTVEVDGPGPDAGTRDDAITIVEALSERFERTATRVLYRPDATIFACRRVPRVALAQWLEDLTFLVPALTIGWAIAGDETPTSTGSSTARARPAAATSRACSTRPRATAWSPPCP